MKVQLAGMEVQFLEDHVTLVEANNANAASTNSQTRLFEGLCHEVKSMTEKMDRLCVRAVRLENIGKDVSTFSKAVQGVVETTDIILSFFRAWTSVLTTLGMSLSMEQRSRQSRRLEPHFRGRNLKSFNG